MGLKPATHAPSSGASRCKSRPRWWPGSSRSCRRPIPSCQACACRMAPPWPAIPQGSDVTLDWTFDRGVKELLVDHDDAKASAAGQAGGMETHRPTGRQPGVDRALDGCCGLVRSGARRLQHQGGRGPARPLDPADGRGGGAAHPGCLAAPDVRGQRRLRARRGRAFPRDAGETGRPGDPSVETWRAVVQGRPRTSSCRAGSARRKAKRGSAWRPAMPTTSPAPGAPCRACWWCASSPRRNCGAPPRTARARC